VQRMASPETGAWRVVDRADLMFRQVNQALEAINRSVAGIAAYELEYRRTGDHAGALRYAHDHVHDTMGDYSAANSSPLFNSRVGRVALQFKKYAQKSYGLLGRLAADSFHGDKGAMKAFAGVVITHGVMAGALGMPGMELVKAALFVPGLFGGYSWDKFQEFVRATAASMFGKDIGEAFTRGAPRLVGVDTSGRMGWADLAMPRDNPTKPADLYKWVGQSVAGAPGGLPVEVANATLAALKGDGFGVLDAQPSKFLRDAARAVKGYNSGFQDPTGRTKVNPLSGREAIVQLFGFKPGRVADLQEENATLSRETRERNAQRRDLMNKWLTADPGNKASAMQAVLDFNRALPAGALPITRKELAKAQSQRREELREGTYVEGKRVTKQNRDIYKRLQEVY